MSYRAMTTNQKLQKSLALHHCASACITLPMISQSDSLGRGYNYSKNMRGIYDVQSLNAFVEVNPATMRGQEGFAGIATVFCCL